MQIAGAIDFADMVPLLFGRWTMHAGYGAKASQAPTTILLVDEYQDVNPGQVELIDRFVRAGLRFGWSATMTRRSTRSGRLTCASYWILQRNIAPRRCMFSIAIIARRHSIVEAAKRLIANSRARRHKDYQPTTAEPGEIVIRGYKTPEIEARQVARGSGQSARAAIRREQIAVLYRVGSVGLALQPALQQLKIPYEVRGAGDLWQGVAARLVVGSLHYLREGESVDAMSRMGSSQARGNRPSQARPCREQSKTLHSPAHAVRARRSRPAVPSQASDRARAEWTSIVEA